MIRKEQKKIETYLIITGITVFINIIGLIADFSSISESSWFSQVLSSKIMIRFSYFLSIILLFLAIYIYQVLKKKLEVVEKEYNQEIEKEHSLNNRHWERMIRTFRAILLNDLPTPSIKDSLDPILDELAKRLPENGINFKMSVAKPLTNGGFKILAARGMDPASIHLIESRSNWIEKKSFFSNGIFLDEDKPYAKYISGSSNYENIQRPTGIGNAKSHFVIAIKNNNYKKDNYPENTLAVLSIGIPSEHSFSDDENQAFYNKIYPIVKTIEANLLINSLNN